MELPVLAQRVHLQGPGSRVQVSGFRVQSAGCRVQGAGFRVQGAGCRVQGSEFRVQGPGFMELPVLAERFQLQRERANLETVSAETPLDLETVPKSTGVSALIKARFQSKQPLN